MKLNFSNFREFNREYGRDAWPWYRTEALLLNGKIVTIASTYYLIRARKAGAIFDKWVEIEFEEM